MTTVQYSNVIWWVNCVVKCYLCQKSGERLGDRFMRGIFDKVPTTF